MKIDEWLKRATNILKDSNIGTARLDALVLLEDTTGKERGWLLAHPEFEISKSQLKKLESHIKRRAMHEPLSYIRGKTEFYGREFAINKDVLEPRPESETMIDLLKQIVDKSSRLQRLSGVQGEGEQRSKAYSQYDERAAQPATPQSVKSTGGVAGLAGQQAGAALTIVDVGTGSGALAITVELEIPTAEVIATDIDQKCLVVAKKNAEELGTEIKFFKGNLLEPIYSLLPTHYSLLCNLPYVPDNYQLNSAAMNEPKIAIFGGPDGLDLYRQLFEQIDSLASKPSYVLTESLPPQHKKLAAIAKAHGYKLEKAADFIQVFKILN